MPIGQHRREWSTAADVVLAVVAYALLVRWHIGTQVDNWYGVMAPLVVAVWWLLSVLVRRDVSYRLGGFDTEFRETVSVNAAGAVLLLALNLLVEQIHVSRLVLVGFPILSCVLSLALRVIARTVVAAWRKHGHDRRHVLLVGPATSLGDLATVLAQPGAGLRPVGCLQPAGTSGTEATAAAVDLPPRLGSYAEITDVLHDRVIDVVAIAAPLDEPGLRAVIDAALCEGKALWLMLDRFGARLHGRAAAGALVSLSGEGHPLALACKRVLDVAGAIVALLLASPFLAACALAVRGDGSGGPILFRQKRVGLHGRTFVCYKFRTMVPDAEDRRAALLDRNEMDGPVFKIRADPRITAVGRVLRRYSLDELPQLWNVLRGDMSLVGPRPPLPEEVAAYAPEFRRRLAFRPGLTCLWQVSGRNGVDFRRWMELDLRYVDNWSFPLDLLILLRTIPTVLFGTGV